VRRQRHDPAEDQSKPEESRRGRNIRFSILGLAGALLVAAIIISIVSGVKIF
jgi:hypothetical protein